MAGLEVRVKYIPTCALHPTYSSRLVRVCHETEAFAVVGDWVSISSVHSKWLHPLGWCMKLVVSDIRRRLPEELCTWLRHVGGA